MSNAPKPVLVDRQIASQLNPLISRLWTEDTLDISALVIHEISCLIPLPGTEPTVGGLHHVLDAVAAALEWERDNLYSISASRNKSAEVPHGR